MKGTRKRGAIRLAMAALLVLVMVLCGCSFEDLFGKLNLSGTVLFDQAKDAGPRFAASSASASMHGAKAAPRALTSGGTLSRLYSMMRDYDEARDAGTIDKSNIYCAMSDLSRWVGEASSSLSDKAYDTETEVAPTIALSLPLAKYTRGGTSVSLEGYPQSWALDKNGDVVEVLFTRDETSSDQATEMVIQASYDETAGDIEYDLCYTVEYLSANTGNLAHQGDTYAPRVWLKGNAQSHEFQIKGLWYDGNPTMGTKSIFSYAATGVAQGTDEYMIFHVISGPVGGTQTECYYKIPAGAMETDLEAIEASYPAGMTLAEVTAVDSKGYLADLPATLFTEADAGTTTSSYANGNILTPLP
jgi:hypothetical protein